MSKSVQAFGALPLSGFVRQRQLIPHIVPFSSATLWRKVKSGEFPRPVKLSARVTAWPVEGIRAWINARSEKPTQIKELGLHYCLSGLTPKDRKEFRRLLSVYRVDGYDPETVWAMQLEMIRRFFPKFGGISAKRRGIDMESDTATITCRGRRQRRR